MACPVCGAGVRMDSPARPWALVRGVAYYRCPRCGFVRMESRSLPEPEDEKARYLLHRNDPADPGYRSYLEGFAERAVLPFAAPGARVLDFGSGPEPALASLLSSRGFRVSVYDPFFAPDRTALRGPFDLIILHEVAEHLRRPYFELSRLARRLAPGGCLAVRTKRVPEDAERFAGWWYREDPTHVGFFGGPAIAALADRLGLEVALDDGAETAVLGAAPHPVPHP